ncbi:MAG: SDR family NAD(P)-dependent oxidoreductase, partial [Nitrospinota bacterium]
MKLKDQVALVTGGGRGIGLAICRCLAEEGAAVVVADVDEAAAREAASSLEGWGPRVRAVSLDVREEGSVRRAVRETLDGCGRIDVQVNNAGVL